MLSTKRARSCLKAIAPSSNTSHSIPSFLLPAFQHVLERKFSISRARNSHIGKAPLSIPPEVNFAIHKSKPTKGMRTVPQNAVIEGPLGQFIIPLEGFIRVDYDTTARKAHISVENKDLKRQREMWGTTRADLQNYILGVSEGHSSILRLVGVGYRATIEDKPTVPLPATHQSYEGEKFVSLKVGYSHPIELPVPKGIKASAPQPTRLLLEGIDKRKVASFAAKIREWRKPEPYKGKGIFVNDETIKLKAKKIK